jgi:DNA repair exonuclease SbcCD ATPase subunit
MENTENKPLPTTWSVKLDEDTKQEIKGILEQDGQQAKELFKDMLGLYKLNKLKDVSFLSADADELKTLTTRIINIYANAGERFDTLIKDRAREHQAEKEHVKSIVDELKELTAEQEQELKALNETLKEVQADRVNLETDLNTKVYQANQVNQKNEALISEYKEKIDTLTGLVNEFKGFKEEVTALKQEREQQKEANNELKDKLKEAEQEQEQTNKEILAQQQKHKEALESLKNKMVLECEKEALRVQKAQQDELQRVRDEYNTQLKELFSQLREKEQPEPEQKQGKK